jgi:hypothetical protein
MKGYLSQIGSAGGAGLSPARMLRPFIRSRSPIAENDQRIGISEWELPTFMEVGEASLSDTAAQDDLSAPLATDIPRRSPTERPYVAPKILSGLEPSGTAPAPVKTIVAQSQPASGEPRSFPPNPQSWQPASEGAFEPEAPSKRKALHHGNELPGIPPTKDADRTVAVEGKALAAASRSQRSITPLASPFSTEPGPAHLKRDASSGSNKALGDGPERKISQLERGRVDSRNGEEPTLNFSAAETSMTKDERDSSPRVPFDMPAAVAPPDSPPPQVVIDRLEIEVIAPSVATAAAKPSGKPDRKAGVLRPQRSVSQIGPLSQGTASRHYLSLRYR